MAPIGVGQRSDLLLWHNRIARDDPLRPSNEAPTVQAATEALD